MKKFIVMLLSLVVVLGLGSDLSFGLVNKQYYGGENLYKYHFISGSSSDSMVLNEDKDFTREQLAVLILEISGKSEAAIAANLTPNFVDNDEITWSAPYVAYCAQEGLMGGSPVEGSELNRFNPKGIVSGQQLATVLYGALGYEPNWNTVLDDVAALGLWVQNKPLTRGEAFNFIWDAVMLPVAADRVPLAVTVGKMTEDEVEQARKDAIDGELVVPESDDSTTDTSTEQTTEATSEATEGTETVIPSTSGDTVYETPYFTATFVDGKIVDGLEGTRQYEVTLELENKTQNPCFFYVARASINRERKKVSSDLIPYSHPNQPTRMIRDIEVPVDMMKEEVTDIGLVIRMAETESDETIVEEQFRFYPQGKEKATKYKRQSLPTDVVLLDKDGLKIISTGAELEVGYYTEYMDPLVFENNTSKVLHITGSNVLMNGEPIDSDRLRYGIPNFSLDVDAGETAAAYLIYDDVDTEVNTMEMTIEVSDVSGNLLMKEDVEFTPLLKNR